MQRLVLGHRNGAGAHAVLVDVDAADVLGVLAGLRDQYVADPLSLGKQVVRVPADDGVDLRTGPRQAAVVDRRLGHVEPEVREDDDDVGSAIA